MKGGWPVQTVVAQADLDLEGKPLPATFAGLMTFKSAMAYQVMCFSPSVLYEQSKGNFAAIMDTFHITK